MLSKTENCEPNPLKKCSKGNVADQIWTPRWYPDLTRHVAFRGLFERVRRTIFKFLITFSKSGGKSTEKLCFGGLSTTRHARSIKFPKRGLKRGLKWQLFAGPTGAWLRIQISTHVYRYTKKHCIPRKIFGQRSKYDRNDPVGPPCGAPLVLVSCFFSCGNALKINLLEGPTGTRPGELSWQCPHAEFGWDSQSSFPQNADLDPKIEECRLNPTRRDHSESWRATFFGHEKPSKGHPKVVRALGMLEKWVLFGLAREPLSVTYYYYYLLLLTYTNLSASGLPENRASPGIILGL